MNVFSLTLDSTFYKLQASCTCWADIIFNVKLWSSDISRKITMNISEIIQRWNQDLCMERTTTIGVMYTGVCAGRYISFIIKTWFCCFVFIAFHDDVIKWSHFPRYWPFARGIHRSPVNSPHKGQWRGTLMFTLICARINGWVNNCEAGDLRRSLWRHRNVVVDSQPQPNNTASHE